SLICVLPRGAAPGELFEIADVALEVRTDQLVRFRAYSSSHGRSRAGDIVAWREGEFHALPPLQTIIRTADPSHPGTALLIVQVPLMNAVGRLQISCVSFDPVNQHSWPLEFNLRLHDQGSAGVPGPAREPAIQIEPNAMADALETACEQIRIV